MPGTGPWETANNRARSAAGTIVKGRPVCNFPETGAKYRAGFGNLPLGSTRRQTPRAGRSPQDVDYSKTIVAAPGTGEDDAGESGPA